MSSSVRSSFTAEHWKGTYVKRFVTPFFKNFLYRHNGNGTFTQVTNSPVVLEGGHSCTLARIARLSRRLHRWAPGKARMSRHARLLKMRAEATPQTPPDSVSLVVTSPRFLDVVDYANCWGVNNNKGTNTVVSDAIPLIVKHLRRCSGSVQQFAF
jgi:hypothetical protein